MRLQSHDEFAVVARFRPVDGDFEAMARDEASGLLAEPLGGHFSQRLGPLVVLYRSDRGLRLRVGDVECGLDQISAQWSRTDETARLTLETPSGVQVFGYRAATIPEFDFTAGAEQEHFDFGLFLVNVIADKERAFRLYSGVSST